MILCLCKGVSDRQIKELVQSGHTLQEIIDVTQVGTCCGSCQQDLALIIHDEQLARCFPNTNIHSSAIKLAKDNILL